MKTKKTISLGLTLALALSLITPALAAPTPQATSKVVCSANGRSPFSDVPSTHWGIDGILWAGPAADLAAFLVTLVFILLEMKEIRRREAEQI